MAKKSGKGGGGGSKVTVAPIPAPTPAKPEKAKTGMAENKNWYGMKWILWIVGILIVLRTIGVIGNNYTNSNTSGNQSSSYSPTEIKEALEKKLKKMEPEVAKALKITHYPKVQFGPRSEEEVVEVTTDSFSKAVDLSVANGYDVPSPTGDMEVTVNKGKKDMGDKKSLERHYEFDAKSDKWYEIDSSGKTEVTSLGRVYTISFKAKNSNMLVTVKKIYN